ncbi:MAG: methyltransferase domain-containing protein [Candidatus Saccharimonadales bacterium]
MSSSILKKLTNLFKRDPIPYDFKSSSSYWINRYVNGGNSGAGSYNHLARFKAEVINSFVKTNNINSVIEFGAGDGNQLRYADYPQYIGVDISQTAVELCRALFRNDPAKQFMLLSDYSEVRCELALSLDVIFHLVEDEIFSDYMHRLFRAATRFVIIYSSNTPENTQLDAPHVRHREFTRWVDNNAPDWRFLQKIANPYPYNGDYKTTSFSDFYLYRNITIK